VVLSIIDAARIVCGARSVQGLNVCLSVCPNNRLRHAAGLLLTLLSTQSTAVGALQAQAAATALQQAPVLSSKHEQQHPDIQRKRLNTELLAKRSRKWWRYQVEEKAVDNASDVRF